MTILEIKEKGKLIHLTGFPQLRTPVKIDITNLDIDLLIKELRLYNIKNYQMTNKNRRKKVKKGYNYQLKILEKINNIEKILQGLTDNKYVRNDVINLEKMGKRKPIYNEEIFIPTMDSFNTQNKNNITTTKTISNTDNINKNAQLLRNLDK